MKLRNFLVLVSSILIPIFLFFNQYLLLGVLLRLNIFRNKKIKTHNQKKKILVLTKTSGLEDIIYAFGGNKKNNFEVYELPRALIKKIFSFYLNSKVVDYNYHIKDQSLNLKKEQYREVLTKILFFLKKFIQIDIVLSFNAFYFAEVEMRKAAIKNSIKFVVLHKENIYSPIENEILFYMYENLNQKFDGTKLLVYSENEKKLFLNSNLVKKNQISVVGIPRADGSILSKKIKPKNKILYFLIEENRGLPNYLLKIINRTNRLPKKIEKKIKEFPKKNNFWKNMANTKENYLINFAKKNPNYEIIFKGKVGIHEKKFHNLKLPKNIKLIKSGTGDKFIRECKIVIAFNTTAMFEAISAGRSLIIPNYCYDKKKFKKDFLIQMNKKYLANTVKIFDRMIKHEIKKKYQNRKFNFHEKKILEYYTGNFKADSSKRLIKNFEDLI